MTPAATIRIVEVGPRDGLQAEPRIVPVAQRVALIETLAASGLREIEAGSFVSPVRVPQMQDTAEVLRALPAGTDVRYPVLTPNAQGMEAAIDAGARDVAVFVSASESFSRRNINVDIDTSLVRAAEVTALAKGHDIRVRGYVSCAWGCPYEGAIAEAAVARVALRLAELGCAEISIADTIGVGTPGRARAVIRAVAAEVPIARLAVHFHDTYGQALANVAACLEEGIGVVDSAAGGLGGCPFADGASGNLATEDLLYMLDGMGVATGVDMHRLLDAVAFVDAQIGIAPRSKLFVARRGGDRRYRGAAGA